MARFNLLALLTVALASSFTTAVPVAETEAMSPKIEARASFLYRFYTQGSCNHNDPWWSTYPENDLPPLTGHSGGTCYNAPTSAGHNRLEIDQQFSGVITFCHVDCSGAGSVHQSGTNCYLPPPNCAIGSFKIV